MAYTVSHFINGKSYVNATGKFQDLYNPATGKVIGRVALADKADVDKAIQAAKEAFPAWAATPPLKRAQVLFKYSALLKEHLDELATLITNEHGKTLNDARASIQRGIDVVDYACGVPNHLTGNFVTEVGAGIDNYSIRQPLGVCVGITPFNFPAMIPLWMFPIAIACGNTFVLKPSEKDPSCSVRLAELMQEAGLPKGILNVIQGEKTAVETLITHPDVKAISFVGSTPVAETIYKTGTQHGKRVQSCR